MSGLTDKELQLMEVVVTNLTSSVNDFCFEPSDRDPLQVNWDKTALDAGYKDAKNAKVMWGRLTKKLADIAATHATAGDNNDAGEGSADAPATSSKKRKATSTSQADKSTAKVGRPAKKTKGPAADNVKIEGEIEQQGREEAV